MFGTVGYFRPSLILAGKARSHIFDKGILQGLAPVFRANIRLRWKCLPVINTLAYYTIKFMTSAKCFTVQAHCFNDKKTLFFSLSMTPRQNKLHRSSFLG